MMAKGGHSVYASPILEVGPERRPAYKLIVFLAALAAAFGFGLLALNAPRSGAGAEGAGCAGPAGPAPGPARCRHRRAGCGQRRAVRPHQVLAALACWRTACAGSKRASRTSVVFDLALTQRTQTGDEGLWRTMANNRNVLLGMAYDADRPADYTPDDIRSLVFLEKFALAGNLTLGAQLPEFPYYSVRAARLGLHRLGARRGRL